MLRKRRELYCTPCGKYQSKLEARVNETKSKCLSLSAVLTWHEIEYADEVNQRYYVRKLSLHCSLIKIQWLSCVEQTA